ncbi:putative Asp/Glu racemase [Glarea lozoyensis ATCC 20868]|uniref:Putative Asp/Glu racemase n=1 Tax=Glarea lozoyensis (strain ATCC 20868 / MF5171) TaxID=1116229 RepID=S3CR57_GLAL2|nr:putative Asp/Glu racemase [Glarea lozoyensis ATCC 20868]EPE28937.1 putative Asp/Glu racemase [Glarea lozoyensis ATCC 20868]
MATPRIIRLGILVPSSNTALEPLTFSMINDINIALSTSTNPVKITVHFSRFPVTKISLDPSGLAQFDLPPILAAATLLAHAQVDVIGWSGTSAGWLGFDRDELLCNEIEKATGIKATSSIVGLNKALELWGVKKLALVTPYLDDVQEKIIQNYKAIGVEIGSAEKHLRIEKNCDIAEVSEAVLDDSLEDVIGGNKVDAITTFCTNLVAARRVEHWEKRHHVPVFDTVTTVVWDMLKLCDFDTTKIKGWGLLFQR